MTQLTIIRTYFAGKTLGVVYAIDGVRCATLIGGTLETLESKLHSKLGIEEVSPKEATIEALRKEFAEDCDRIEVYGDIVNLIDLRGRNRRVIKGGFTVNRNGSVAYSGRGASNMRKRCQAIGLTVRAI